MVIRYNHKIDDIVFFLFKIIFILTFIIIFGFLFCRIPACY